MKLGMILTGGGSDVIPMLLRNGGASSYFSFAEVPYSKESTANLIGYHPNKYSSLELAEKFAWEAEEKLKYMHDDEDYIAVGSTAKLFVRDQRPDRENSAWIVVRTYDRILEIGIEFLIKKREKQEKILANTIQAVVDNEINKYGYIDYYTKFHFLGNNEPGYSWPKEAKLIHLRW